MFELTLILFLRIPGNLRLSIGLDMLVSSRDILNGSSGNRSMGGLHACCSPCVANVCNVVHIWPMSVM